MVQKLGELLHTVPVIRQAQALAALQKRFDEVLPPQFRGEVQVVALKAGELRILCKNGAIATRLRLETAALVRQLESRGLSVRRIRVQVKPICYPHLPPKKPKPSLPDAAKLAFKAAISQLEDGQLKAALEKLLRHHQS